MYFLFIDGDDETPLKLTYSQKMPESSTPNTPKLNPIDEFITLDPKSHPAKLESEVTPTKLEKPGGKGLSGEKSPSHKLQQLKNGELVAHLMVKVKGVNGFGESPIQLMLINFQINYLK